MKTWTLYWIGGKREEIHGKTIDQAFTAAGYGAGALKAVDFYMNGSDKDYVYNKEIKDWDKKEKTVFDGI